MLAFVPASLRSRHKRTSARMPTLPAGGLLHGWSGRIESVKKFALGFVIGLIFAGLVVLILAFAAIRLGGERKVTVADGSTLVLHLEGDLPEQPPVELPLPFLEQRQSLTVLETWQIL